MKILKSAVAGTLESSDVMITVSPSDTLVIDLDSTVKNQYGKAIMKCVETVLEELSVVSGEIKVVDKGALDCSIRARLQSAIFQAAEVKATEVPWKEVVK